MKTLRWMLVVTLAIALVPAVTAKEDEEYKPPEDREQTTVTTGAQGSSVEGAENRVSEYEVTEPTPILGLGWATSPYDAVGFSFNFERWNSDQYFGSASLDLNRTVRVNATLDSLLHRLDHDPLNNLDAVSELKVVRSTDLEPGRDYQIRRRIYDVNADFHPKGLGWFSYRVGYRNEQREGTRQVLNTSHCTSCHVVAQGREIDRATTDVTFGAHVSKGGVDVDYELLSRQFQEDGATPTAPYEEAFRPATPGSFPDQTVLVAPFNDRLWFQNGDLPIDMVPEIKRVAHKLKARGEIGKKSAANFTLVRSTTENRYTGLQYDFTGARGRYTWKPQDDLRVNFSARHDSLKNDTTLVNVADLFGVSGAPISDRGPGYTGITFQQYVGNVITGRRPAEYLSQYDLSTDFTEFTRLSSMNRDDDRLGVDVYWKPSRKNSVRAGYQYRVVDREHIVLADGTGETKSHTLKLSWTHRAAKRLRWHNNLRYKTTDNPYVNVDGAMREYVAFIDPVSGGLVGQPSPASPKNPVSYQYFELQQFRVANVSNVPTDEMKFRSQATWSPKPNISLSGNVRHRDAENDELDWTSWEHSSTGVGVNLWIAPSPEFQLTLGGDRVQQETEATVIVPIMDG